MTLIGTLKGSGPAKLRLKRTRNKSEEQCNKHKLEGNPHHRTKRTVRKRTATMIGKRRIQPQIAKDDVPIIAGNNDELRRLEKLEEQLNKMVLINKGKQ